MSRPLSAIAALMLFACGPAAKQTPANTATSQPAPATAEQAPQPPHPESSFRIETNSMPSGGYEVFVTNLATEAATFERPCWHLGSLFAATLTSVDNAQLSYSTRSPDSERAARKDCRALPTQHHLEPGKPTRVASFSAKDLHALGTSPTSPPSGKYKLAVYARDPLFQLATTVVTLP